MVFNKWTEEEAAPSVSGRVLLRSSAGRGIENYGNAPPPHPSNTCADSVFGPSFWFRVFDRFLPQNRHSFKRTQRWHSGNPFRIYLASEYRRKFQSYEAYENSFHHTGSVVEPSTTKKRRFLIPFQAPTSCWNALFHCLCRTIWCVRKFVSTSKVSHTSIPSRVKQFRFQPVNGGILIHRRRWAMGIGFGSKDAAVRGDPDLWFKGKWQNDVEKKIKGKTFEAQKKHILVGVCLYSVPSFKKSIKIITLSFEIYCFPVFFSEHFQFFEGSTPSTV